MLFKGMALQKRTSLYLLWIQFGNWLGRHLNPVVLGLLFFFLIVPVGLVMKVMGKDLLRRKFTSDPTYWVQREVVSPNFENMKDQF